MKDSKLTTTEMEAMRDHPVIGDRIIKPVSFLGQIRFAVHNHHEWWDGTGYPDRLKGEEIPLSARIINAADTWDACTSTRPYQRALPEAEALAVIAKLTGTQIDPAVGAALQKVVARRREKASVHDSSPLPRVVQLVRKS
jgi:HD-GYP domain-containing protein (c-di-GMP phosphodiesterase class II)